MGVHVRPDGLRFDRHRWRRRERCLAGDPAPRGCGVVRWHNAAAMKAFLKRHGRTVEGATGGKGNLLIQPLVSRFTGRSSGDLVGVAQASFPVSMICARLNSAMN